MIITEEGYRLPTLMDGKILGFFGDFRPLSNYHVCPLIFEGKEFHSAEAAYMYCKTEIPEEKELFVGIMTPKKAKALGQTVTLRKDWESTKVFYMTRVLYAKFSQQRPLKELLLSTGDKYLEETNNWEDRFWGADAEGNGLNMLGKCLMFVRDVL